MVAYKNDPALIDKKMPQGQDCHLSCSATKTRYDISDTYAATGNRIYQRDSALIQNNRMNDQCLDNLIQNHINNGPSEAAEDTQNKKMAPDTIRDTSIYKDYLSQPIWFYKIMEILESKEKKKTSFRKQSYISRN